MLGPMFFFIVLGVFAAGGFIGFLRGGKLIASGASSHPAAPSAWFFPRSALASVASCRCRRVHQHPRYGTSERQLQYHRSGHARGDQFRRRRRHPALHRRLVAGLYRAPCARQPDSTADAVT